jgi:hypothetical protein
MNALMSEYTDTARQVLGQETCIDSLWIWYTEIVNEIKAV